MLHEGWRLLALLVMMSTELVSPFRVLKETCGYESCTLPEADTLNVHIVPHSHDDVGWLKTVDQYYYGSRNGIQKAGVQYIIDSVVKELWEDPKRRFIYVETAFFWKWWSQQSDDVQDKVHALVRQGRLQFVGGAWSMNDEAASHYQSTIDQFTWGLRKLNDTFGACGRPTVGWQIDPFGHSREMASLLAGMGYDGLFLGRIDYQDKKARLNDKRMEMLWRGDDDLGAASDLFTGVLYNTYSPPRGFCFDVLCDDEPIVDDTNSPLYNVDERVAAFIKIVEDMASGYRTRNVLVTMGDDFNYQDAAMWFKNLDKLITYTNLAAAKNGTKLKLFYSTPNCYLNAVRLSRPKLPTKKDDFFPYASDSTAYWTGYFTSRPTTKWFEREGNDYLQMVKQVQVLAGLEAHNQFVLDELKSAIGVMQHHDAITGTEKQHVAHDYERILDTAIEDSLIIARQALNKWIQGDAQAPPLSLHRCRLNQSECAVSEHSDQFIVTVYNPLAWKLDVTPIRIPVADGKYNVTAPNGDVILSQLVELPDTVLTIPTRKSDATHELVFLAYNIKSLGYKNFYVKRLPATESSNTNSKGDATEINGNRMKRSTDDNTLQFYPNDQTYYEEESDVFREQRIPAVALARKDREAGWLTLDGDKLRMLGDDPYATVERLPEDTILENKSIKLHIDHDTNQIKLLTLPDGTSLPFGLQLLYYPACAGNNTEPSFRSSGAYIFRPNASAPMEISRNISAAHFKGSVVEETQFKLTDYASLAVRIYKHANIDYVENEWLIGSIPVEDDIGKEIVVRYTSTIVNNGEFYTDSNGRQMLRRRLNQRPEWNLTLEEPVPGNYYPITNRMFIQDGETRMAVLTDRSQGGTSLRDGDIELMLHRRLLHDDAFGVGEALDEEADGVGLHVRGKHRIFVTKSTDGAAKIAQRREVLEMHLQPLIFVSNADHVDWTKLANCHGSLKNPLPDGVHLLTLEPFSEGKLLLRLENYLEKADGNSDLQVELDHLFTTLNLVSLRETTLAANEWLENKEKWSWDTTTGEFSSVNEERESVNSGRDEATSGGTFKVTLAAKQIRTFVVEYELVDVNCSKREL